MIREPPGETDREDAADSGQHPVCRGRGPPAPPGIRAFLFNTHGSHRTYHDASGRVLTIVRPHGGRKTCDPDDIKTLLEVLGL
jgi:hypothetical protein